MQPPLTETVATCVKTLDSYELRKSIDQSNRQPVHMNRKVSKMYTDTSIGTHTVLRGSIAVHIFYKI